MSKTLNHFLIRRTTLTLTIAAAFHQIGVNKNFFLYLHPSKKLSLAEPETPRSQNKIVYFVERKKSDNSTISCKIVLKLKCLQKTLEIIFKNKSMKVKEKRESFDPYVYKSSNGTFF